MCNNSYYFYLFSLLILLFIEIFPVKSFSQPYKQKKSPEEEYYLKFAKDWLEMTPVQGNPGPLRFKRTGFIYTCNECHQDLKTQQKYYKPTGEHRNIVLNHGLNVNCLNCHYQYDRNYYAAYGNDKISAEESFQVCMKCHGPIYRDWEANIHGRVNGYWDAELGPQKKLDCIQCHDPHSPDFKNIIPMPPPEVSRIKTLIQGNSHE
jgi:hypothetical protein